MVNLIEELKLIAVRMENLRVGDWDEIQNKAHRVRNALEIKLVFGCFYVFDIANTEIHTWTECNKYHGMRRVRIW